MIVNGGGMSDENSRKASLTQEGTPVDFSCLFRILNWSISLILLAGILGCDVKPKEKPLSLGSFTEISRPSISPDGNQLLFTGCGHKDFSQCTMYRFERDSNKLYRYLPRNSTEMLYGGRYSPVSNKIAFSIIPLDSNNEKVYDETQVAVVNQDGSGLRIITQSKGLKLNPVLSYDEMCVVFSKGRISDSGSPLRKQKSRVLGSDLYKVDIRTGEETQLTRLAFYSVGETYITPDGKGVVFNGDTPMRLPHTDNFDAVKQFEDDYKKKYNGNKIMRYPLDGSGVENEPVPLFTFDNGAEMPTIERDGSVWFKGLVGTQQFIHYYQRFSDGALKELSYEMLGEGKEGAALIVLLDMVVTPDGSQLATLNENQETRQRYLGVLDTRSNVHTNLTIPATAENIFIQ
jgi:hypothetical protein